MISSHTPMLTRSSVVPVFWVVTTVKCTQGATPVQVTEHTLVTFALVAVTAEQQRQHWQWDRRSIYKDCRELAACRELCTLQVANWLKMQWLQFKSPHFEVNKVALSFLEGLAYTCRHWFKHQFKYFTKQGSSCCYFFDPITLSRLCHTVGSVASFPVKGSGTTRYAAEYRRIIWGICLDAASYQQHLVNTDCKDFLMK